VVADHESVVKFAMAQKFKMADPMADKAAFEELLLSALLYHSIFTVHYT